MEQRLLTALLGTVCILLVIPAVGCLIHLIRTAILRVIGQAVGGETAWFIANRATFLGVVHHECAHALVAILTGVMYIYLNYSKHGVRAACIPAPAPYSIHWSRLRRSCLAAAMCICCGTMSFRCARACGRCFCSAM